MVWVKSVGSAETQLTRSDRRREEGRMGFPLMINRRLTPQIRYNSILRGVNTTACHTEEAADIRWVPHVPTPGYAREFLDRLLVVLASGFP
jgi:hypothetical protein